ncbi:MAG: hypothetical protein U0234_10355 [Sandaracinus sp.]
MRRRSARAWAALSSVVLAGCAGGSIMPTDAGVHVPDVGPDAVAWDAAVREDAPQPDAFAPRDAGPDAYVSPWRPPAFEPHLVESHPEVVCQPLDLGFDAPVREPAHPGDVRWVYEIDRDASLPDLLRRTGSTSTQIEDDGLTGTTNGGVSFHVGPNAEVGITSAGTVAFVTPAQPRARGPSVRLDRRQAFLSLEETGQYAFRIRVPGSTDPAVGVRMPDSLEGSPTDVPRVNDARPIVFAQTGVVVWLARSGLLASSCLHDGRLRWALAFDDPEDMPDYPPVMGGLADGSTVLEARPGHLVRVAADGSVMLSRYEDGYSFSSVTDRCGVLASTIIDNHIRFEWWTVDAFEAGPSFPFAEDPPLNEAISSAISVLSDCRLLAGRRVPDGPTRLVGWGESGMWATVLPDVGGQRQRIVAGSVALANAAALVIAITDHLVLTLVEGDGTTRWARDYPETGVPDLSAPAGLGAVLLTPDGTLYLLMRRDGSVGGHYLMAVEIGEGPEDMVVVGTGWGGIGLNWARTSAPLPP